MSAAFSIETESFGANDPASIIDVTQPEHAKADAVAAVVAEVALVAVAQRSLASGTSGIGCRRSRTRRR